MLFPAEHLKSLIEKTSSDRLAICKDCHYNSTQGEITLTSRCKACSCPLHPKTRCLSCSCGIDVHNKRNKLSEEVKWTAIVDLKTDSEIRKAIADAEIESNGSKD